MAKQQVITIELTTDERVQCQNAVKNYIEMLEKLHKKVVDENQIQAATGIAGNIKLSKDLETKLL